MKKIVGLAIGAVAVLAFNGCQPVNGNGEGQVYDNELSLGYKISGRDTIINKDVDLCFYGSEYVYGRGSEYFEGTFNTSGGDVVFKDATDGGSYRLTTNGEIIEGYTYYFHGINNNIHVDTISRSYSVGECKGVGSTYRTSSSLGLAKKEK